MAVKSRHQKTRKIQNHSNRDKIFEENYKIHIILSQKESRCHERTQNTASSGKNQQLQTQTDTTCLQYGQVSTPICYYGILASRKEKPTPPTKETSG
jgi:hypothetical protein